MVEAVLCVLLMLLAIPLAILATDGVIRLGFCLRFRDEWARCPACGREGCLDPDSPPRCWDCGTELAREGHGRV